MFDPQGSIVVECRNAFGGRHEIRSARLGDTRNKLGDGSLAFAVIPRWERSGCACACLNAGSAAPDNIATVAAIVSSTRRLTPKDAFDFTINLLQSTKAEIIFMFLVLGPHHRENECSPACQLSFSRSTVHYLPPPLAPCWTI
jgi:hypothetical protein